jgi:carotenoid cleavage dioxygenase-like enzyme
MHNFAVTPNYVVFFDQPALFDLDALTATGFPYIWKSENGARIGVLPKGGTDGDVRWFETEACYVFHPLNAFEDEGRLILDTPKHPSVYADADRIFAVGVTLERWTVDLDDGRVGQDVVDATPQEFCQLHPNVLGSAHRYDYTVAIGDDTPMREHVSLSTTCPPGPARTTTSDRVVTRVRIRG